MLPFQDGIGRLACLACHIFHNVVLEYVFNLLLLETALDDQLLLGICGACRAKLRKKKHSHMLLGAIHSLADLGKISKKGFFVSFTVDARRDDGILFPIA